MEDQAKQHKDHSKQPVTKLVETTSKEMILREKESQNTYRISGDIRILQIRENLWHTTAKLQEF